MSEPWTWTAQDRADWLLDAVDGWHEAHEAEGLTVEAHAACDTLRAERDEALAQVASARTWAMALEARHEEVRQYVLSHIAHGPSRWCECISCVSWRLLSAPLGAPEQVQG